MPLKLLVRKGKLSPHWYARFVGADGKTYEKNTGVLVKGTPPDGLSLRETGDGPFERSRARAQVKLEFWQEDARKLGRTENLVETLVQIKSGSTPVLWKVSELEKLYREYSRAGERQLQNSSVVFRRFGAFVGLDTKVHAVSVDMLKRFLADLEDPEDADVSPLAFKTRKTYFKTLSAVFARALPAGYRNPFDEVVVEAPKDEDGRKVSAEIHRAPLSHEELAQLFELARVEDPELYPAVVIAAQTGLRKGDVMGLRWEDVSLLGERSSLSLQTGKTGADVQIPCFPKVQEVLDSQHAKRKPGAVHVMPELWEIYKSNPSGLTYRLKKLFIRLEELNGEGGTGVKEVDASEVIVEGRRWIEENITGTKGDKMRKAFGLYMSGESLPDVADTLGLSKGTVSNYLHEIQTGTGLQVLRWTKGSSQREKMKRTQVQRKNGTRAGSVRDWHCLRTTFCTHCLQAGVQEALLRKITGHGTLDLVLKHYFQPDVEGLHAGFASVVKAWG